MCYVMFEFDLLGYLLRQFPRGSFKGQGRLVQLWKASRSPGECRVRTLANGGKIECNVSIPYEAEVWLKRQDEEDLAVLRRLLSPGEVFVDCGANVGLWTIAAAMEVGPTGSVYSFEPNPTVFNKLVRNAELSGLENVHGRQVALGAQSGEASLTCAGANSQISSDETTGDETVNVPVRPLDRFLSGRRVHGCKIDVEGYELEVLKGAEELIEEHHPWFCIEFNPNTINTSKLRKWKVHQFMVEKGYSVCLFGDATKKGKKLEGNYAAEESYVNMFYCYGGVEI